MLPNLDNIKKIFKKEFITIFKDKGSILIMLGAIFLYSFFYLIPFHEHETRNIPIGVVDNDNSTLSREFLRGLNSHRNVTISKYLRDIEEGKQEYYKNNIYGFIVIPENFEKDIKRGEQTKIASYLDSAFLIIYKQIAAAIAETSGYFGTAIEMNTLLLQQKTNILQSPSQTLPLEGGGQGGGENNNSRLIAKIIIKKGVNKDKALSIVSPFEFVQTPLYNPIGSYQNYIYPMVLIMILQQTIIMGASMLCSTDRERLKGVIINNRFEKINSFCPYSKNPVEIVLGKSFAYVLLYLIYSILYFLVFPSIAVYKMTYNITGMFLILIPFLFACAFLGITLTLFCKKREYSMLIIIPSSVPLIFLPGFVWAKEAIPPVLGTISKFIPFEAAADGLVKINQMGASFFQVQNDFWILTGLCVLYFICAVLTVKKIQNEV